MTSKTGDKNMWKLDGLFRFSLTLKETISRFQEDRSYLDAGILRMIFKQPSLKCLNKQL
jgi:hypothetical protein